MDKLTSGYQSGIDTDDQTALSLLGRPVLFSAIVVLGPFSHLHRGLPFLPSRHVLKALLEKCPVFVELLLGLIEVPPIRGESGRLGGHDGSTRGPREARDVL